MLPLPLPLVAPVAVTKLGMEATFHGQLAAANTLSEPLPPEPLTAVVVGDTTGADGQLADATCVTVTVSFPSRNDAVREAPVRLLVVLNDIATEPPIGIGCGLVPSTVSQSGKFAASKRQPGAAVTVKLSVPASPPTVCVRTGTVVNWLEQAWSQIAAYEVESFCSAPPAISTLPFGRRDALRSRARMRCGPLWFQVPLAAL